MAENYAAVLHGPYDVRIENIPVPEIKDDEVLVKMDCVGICGSDVKLYTTGGCGGEVVTKPIVIGHEGAGIVVKTGSRVTSLVVGDRVSIEPTQPCRSCEYCKLGRYNLCAAPHYCSSLGAPGNLCRYYKHVADFCHKMPENLTMEEGAAVQPLAIAMHACNRAGVRLGQRVLILGAGPIGILCAMTARAMGASTILITDVVQSRLDTARELGADYTFLVKKDCSDQEMVDGIVSQLGSQPEVTIDACAFASAQRVAMLVTKKGGVVLVVGIGDSTVEVPLTQALLREVDVRGSFRIVNTCNAGYSGDRCEINICYEYCLNNGTCDLNEENMPFCQCLENYYGDRCEFSNFSNEEESKCQNSRQNKNNNELSTSGYVYYPAILFIAGIWLVMAIATHR